MKGFLLLQYCVIFFVSCGWPQLVNCRGQSNSNRLTSKGPPNSITGDQVLLSPNAKFALGFFTPAAINGVNVVSTAAVANSTSLKRYYLGIWFDDIAEKVLVWVANRENPVVNHSGILNITNDGNIGIFDGDGGVLLWSSNVTASSESTTAKLLDTGNLVLTRGANEDMVWQSFNHPTDSLIEGMKLRFNLKTRIGQRLYAWKIPGKDPAPGTLSIGFDPKSPLQVMMLNGTQKLWRVALWNKQTSNSWNANPSSVTVESIVNNDTEVYYTIGATDQFLTMRITLDVVHGLTYNVYMPKTKNWTVKGKHPILPCETYNRCGPFGICDDISPCKCLQGFQPKSHKEWYVGNFTSGCVRQKELIDCVDRFVKFKKMKFPDKFMLLTNLSARQCEVKCRRSCDCIAYAYANLTQVLIKDSRCFLWHGEELKDLVSNSEMGGDLYVRIASDNVVSSNKRKKLVLVVMVPVLLALVFLILALLYFLRMRRLKTKGSSKIISKTNKTLLPGGASAAATTTFDNGNCKDVVLPTLLEFNCISAATDDFSSENKLGQGGFGSVYKGRLLDGQEIAVKRLSKGSSQGFQEFKNEVELIGKLQHTNLVRLLGWCTHDEERILIYEYLPNQSLDKIIFDASLSATLEWSRRFCIIEGIAQGLLYLHKYSRLRIIHRDLKTSNILLDHAMNPKISDFGLARIFGGNQTEATTKRVVGTYGYMSPEYAMNGIFCEKTDVFSFGVMVLEIITGKRNTGLYPYKESINLLGYAWQVWKEGRVLDLIDGSMGSCSSTTMTYIARCVQVGLLCVEENIMDRPIMSSVVSFLANDNTTTLPIPKRPAFVLDRQPDPTPHTKASSRKAILSLNDLTVTSFGQGR